MESEITNLAGPSEILLWMLIGAFIVIMGALFREMMLDWIRWIALDIWENQIKDELYKSGWNGKPKRKS